MASTVLSNRQLNRTTLARQLLLDRASISVIDATRQLVAWQSQIPNPPYIGLWTRLENFQRDDLTQLMQDRKIVRTAWLRSTLHLMTADDHQNFRDILFPALIRAYKAFNGKRTIGIDMERLLEIATPFLEAEPRATGELRTLLEEAMPEYDGNTMAYAIRTYLPLVQVPPSGTWGTGSRATYTTAQQFLGTRDDPATLRDLLHRYLAAFGPASIMDFQAWTGLVKLGEQIEPMKSELTIYQSESGKELLDLPNATLIDEGARVPIRFLPEYDNLMVAHADRNRIIADADRNKVFLSAARVLGTVLIDGFVGATWKTSRQKKRAILEVTPFLPLDKNTRDHIIDEGEKLIRFIEDSSESFEIQFMTG